MLQRTIMVLIMTAVVVTAAEAVEKLVDFDYTYRLGPRDSHKQKVSLGRLPEGARISIRIEPIANTSKYYAIVCGPGRSADDVLPGFGQVYRNRFNAVVSTEGYYLLHVEPVGGNHRGVYVFRLRILVTR